MEGPSGSDSLFPAESDPALAERLTEEHRRFLEMSYPAWGIRQAGALARQRASGSLSLLLWKGPRGAGTGLVWLETLQTGARVHGLWAEPAGIGSIEEILDAVQRAGTGPVSAVTDVLPGLALEEQSSFFVPKGFWHRAKVLMRRAAQNRAIAPSVFPNVRPITPRDLGPLVGTYARAYSSRPGEFWTWSSPDSWAEAERDIGSHLGADGGWASGFLPNASFVWEDDGRVLGAILVGIGTSGAPYVEDLIVEPESQRKGIGRCLLENAIAELSRQRPVAIELAAIRGGAPYRLYCALGFEEVPPPTGRLDGHWIRGTSPF